MYDAAWRAGKTAWDTAALNNISSFDSASTSQVRGGRWGAGALRHCVSRGAKGGACSHRGRLACRLLPVLLLMMMLQYP